MIFFFWSQSMSHSHDHLPTYEGGVGKLDPLALNHKGFLFFKNCAIFNLFSFIFVFSNKQYNSYNKYMWKCCVHPVYNRGNWDLPTGQRNQPAEPRWTVFLYTSSCQMEFYLNQAFTALPPPSGSAELRKLKQYNFGHWNVVRKNYNILNFNYNHFNLWNNCLFPISNMLINDESYQKYHFDSLFDTNYNELLTNH